MLKKLLTLFLSICIMTGIITFPSTVDAARVRYCGENLTWTFENNVLTIEGTGDMYDYDVSSAPWSGHTIKSIVIGDGVRSIGKNAFCNNIPFVTSISLGSGLKSIGDFAFAGTSLVEEITIPDGVVGIGEAAFNGSGITEITIPDSVTSIGMGAFAYCTRARTLNIGSGIKSIKYMSFARCSSLKNITIPDSVETIEAGAFENCRSAIDLHIGCGVENIHSTPFAGCVSLLNITVDENNSKYCSVNGSLFNKDKTEIILYARGKTDCTYEFYENITAISEWAFAECASLTSITIPDNVTTIGNNAFARCPTLENITVDQTNPNYCSIDGNLYTKGKSKLIQYAIGKTANEFNIPEYVTTIGINAFSASVNLLSINIPESVTEIQQWAFYTCTSLTNVNIPAKVTKINSYVFCGCSSLQELTIPEGITEIGNASFRACKLKNIVIPDSVKIIDEYAFADCIYATTLVLGNGVESINKYAFNKCSRINDITIPDCVKNIGEYAFADCSGARSITIGNGVTCIGSLAFLYCRGVETLTIGQNVETIGGGSFQVCSSLKTITFLGNPKTFENIIFYNCPSLESVYIPDISAWIQNDFPHPSSNPMFYAKKLYSNNKLVSMQKIPDGITEIKPFSFMGCLGCEDLIIPDNVTTVGEYAFYNNDTIKSIYFGDNVTSIGDIANRTVERIRIGRKIVEFSEITFESCEKLTDIYCSGSREEHNDIIPDGAYGITTHYNFVDGVISYDSINNKISVKSFYEYKDAVVYASAYQNKKMQNINHSSVDIKIGENTFDCPEIPLESADTCKIMIWNNEDSITPLFENYKDDID